MAVAAGVTHASTRKASTVGVHTNQPAATHFCWLHSACGCHAGARAAVATRSFDERHGVCRGTLSELVRVGCGRILRIECRCCRRHYASSVELKLSSGSVAVGELIMSASRAASWLDWLPGSVTAALLPGARIWKFLC